MNESSGPASATQAIYFGPPSPAIEAK